MAMAGELDKMGSFVINVRTIGDESNESAGEENPETMIVTHSHLENGIEESCVEIEYSLVGNRLQEIRRIQIPPKDVV